MNEEEAKEICINFVEENNDRPIILHDAIKSLVSSLEKKDKIINSIKKYAQQEIDFATEDIKDYIDDDREGNKDIIGELKEWREHWKEIKKEVKENEQS